MPEPLAPPPAGSATRTAPRGLAVLVALGALLVQLPTFDRTLNFHDEGGILQFSQMVREGGELYRDFFVLSLPASFYVLAGVFELFGESNRTARGLVVAEFCLFAVLFYRFLLRRLPLGWTLAAVLALFCYRLWAYPHWTIYGYSTITTLLLLAMLSLQLRFFDTSKRRWLVAAGLVFGLAVSCKQDFGAAALLSSLALLATAGPERPGRARRAEIACFVGAGAAIGLLHVLHYWRVGILDDFLRFTVFTHFKGMSEYAYTSFPPLFPLFEQDPVLRGPVGTEAFLPGILATVDASWLGGDLFQRTIVVDLALKLFYYGPFALLAGGGLRLWRTRQARHADPHGGWAAEFTLWVLGTCLFLLVQLNRPQDYAHLVVLYWIFIALAAIYLQAALRGRRRLAGATTALAAAALGGWVVWSIELSRGLHQRYSAAIELPRAGVYATPAQARLMEELSAHVQAKTRPGQPIAVMPYFPLLHFYANRPGIHRSAYIAWPVGETPTREAEILRALKEQDVDLFVYNLNRFWSLDTMDRYLPELFAYLVEHYEIERLFAYDRDYALAAARREDEDHRGALLPARADDFSISLRSEQAPPLPIPPERRSEYFGTALWPFRPVMLLEPGLGQSTVASIELEIPAGGRLISACGVHPQHWYRVPAPTVDFAIDLLDATGRQRLYERSVAPMRKIGDLTWEEIDLPLADWAGRRVRLEFSTRTDEATGESLWLGGWGIPRLVGTESPAASAARPVQPSASRGETASGGSKRD